MRKNIRRSAQGLLGDVLRKVPLSGVAEIRVPSDIRKVLVNNIDIIRDNALEIFGKEISKVLAKVDIQGIVDNVLNNYTLKVEAKIELQPKGRRAKTAKKGKK